MCPDINMPDRTSPNTSWAWLLSQSASACLTGASCWMNDEAHHVSTCTSCSGPRVAASDILKKQEGVMWLHVSQGPHWTCWCPSSSLPLSVSWIVEVWIVVHADYQLFIHSVILIECVDSCWSHDICPSVHPALMLPWRVLSFFPPELFCSISWELFLIWFEVKGLGFPMCRF